MTTVTDIHDNPLHHSLLSSLASPPAAASEIISPNCLPPIIDAVPIAAPLLAADSTASSTYNINSFALSDSPTVISNWSSLLTLIRGGALVPESIEYLLHTAIRTPECMQLMIDTAIEAIQASMEWKNNQYLQHLTSARFMDHYVKEKADSLPIHSTAFDRHHWYLSHLLPNIPLCDLMYPPPQYNRSFDQFTSPNIDLLRPRTFTVTPSPHLTRPLHTVDQSAHYRPRFAPAVPGARNVLVTPPPLHTLSWSGRLTDPSLSGAKMPAANPSAVPHAPSLTSNVPVMNAVAYPKLPQPHILPSTNRSQNDLPLVQKRKHDEEEELKSHESSDNATRDEKRNESMSKKQKTTQSAKQSIPLNLQSKFSLAKVYQSRKRVAVPTSTPTPLQPQQTQSAASQPLQATQPAGSNLTATDSSTAINLQPSQSVSTSSMQTSAMNPVSLDDRTKQLQRENQQMKRILSKEEYTQMDISTLREVEVTLLSLLSENKREQKKRSLCLGIKCQQELPKPRSSVCLPCGHVSLCNECIILPTLRCPICLSTITEHVPLNMSESASSQPSNTTGKTAQTEEKQSTSTSQAGSVTIPTQTLIPVSSICANPPPTPTLSPTITNPPPPSIVSSVAAIVLPYSHSNRRPLPRWAQPVAAVSTADAPSSATIASTAAQNNRDTSKDDKFEDGPPKEVSILEPANTINFDLFAANTSRTMETSSVNPTVVVSSSTSLPRNSNVNISPEPSTIATNAEPTK